MKELMPVEIIERKIYLIRGHKIMLDRDLAELYGVETKRLNEQVRRNPKRFPDDFMFQLTEEEAESLWSHFATIKSGRGEHRKYLPYAFTEQGVAMLSSVLSSEQVIKSQRPFHMLFELAMNRNIAGGCGLWN
ncbi:MAG: ORF6N domain-containing protein [Nitrospirae bacterium]|nr:ORF6N domain-containing protein [Nitrospirota bacterium]